MNLYEKGLKLLRPNCTRISTCSKNKSSLASNLSTFLGCIVEYAKIGWFIGRRGMIVAMIMVLVVVVSKKMMKIE